MSIVRLLAIALIVLSISLTAALSPSHSGLTDAAVENAAIMAEDHGSCCDDRAEHVPGCHALPALLPSQALNGSAPELKRAVKFGASILLFGIEPAGPLDPPRTA